MYDVRQLLRKPSAWASFRRPSDRLPHQIINAQFHEALATWGGFPSCFQLIHHRLAIKVSKTILSRISEIEKSYSPISYLMKFNYNSIIYIGSYY